MRRWLAPLVGIAIGLLVALVAVRFMSRGGAARENGTPSKPSDPDPVAGIVLPEDTGSLDTVLFHYVPSLEPLVFATYKDFLTTLDPSTKLVMVVPAGASAQGNAFLDKLDPSLRARTRVIENPSPMSLWSKDRALVVAPPAGGGRTGLLIPLPPDPQWTERANDWRTLASLASAVPDAYYVRELPIYFDAGDFAVTKSRVLIDPNLFERNTNRGVASPESMRELVAKTLHRDVVMLGKEVGDVPRHHMSMYMTPLDDVMLVGDPRLGRAIVGDGYVPGETSPDTGTPLRADDSDGTQARYERAATDLAAAGYKVVRVPTVAFDDKTYFAYTNGVFETRAGKRVAWVPQYASARSAANDGGKGGDDAVAALDAAARKVFTDLGWEVHPVSVRGVYRYHGTIGCLANVLARG